MTKTENNGKIKGFELVFEDDVNNGVYRITYNTTIDPDVLSEDGDLTYENSAVFSWTGPEAGDITKSGDPNPNTIAQHNGQKMGSWILIISK